MRVTVGLMKALSLTFVFTICFLHGQAQKWDKGFAKSDVAYENGDYKKAQKFNLKVKKKATKKLGPKSNIVALALVREAKINTGLGVLTKVEDLITEAISINEERNKENKVEYGYILKEAGKVMILYGNFKNASIYVEQARNAFEEAGVIDEMEAELDVLEAKILAGRGFYVEAIELVDHQTNFFKNKIATAGKKESKPHKQAFAEVLIQKANAYRMMGELKQ